jgi:hypothetical protein
MRFIIFSPSGGRSLPLNGSAVMAMFFTPDRALAAALRMREAMTRINAERGNEDLLLKIGIQRDHVSQYASTTARIISARPFRPRLLTDAQVGDQHKKR